LRCYQDDNSSGGDGYSRHKTGLGDLSRRVRVWFNQARGHGSPPAAPILIAAVAVLVLVAAFHAFTFRVNPDELGVVLRFGKPVRQEPPGLHLRLPYPIDEVYLPKVTRQNIVGVGVRTFGSGDVREERAMLTGDENIIDVSFVVFWHIQEPLRYLFNVQNPEITVRDVAESVLREAVGQSEIRPLLTSARQHTEETARKFMQDMLDHYGAGIHVDQVRLLRVDPPAQIIDAFRDVQAAATDKQRMWNEAEAYSNRVVPEARGEAERILQGAMAYRTQSVAEASGQAARFQKIYEEYRKAPEVTRKRMYLETMERIMSGTDKIIISGKFGQGILPVLGQGPRQTKSP
jgi:modulator of FtsH protease HflK